MNDKRPWSGCLVLLVFCPFIFGFNLLSTVKNEEGNKLYKKGQVGKAKNAYLSALKSQPQSPEIAFNLGNAYYKEDSFKDSLDSYKAAAKDERSPLLQSKAFYNLGNNLFRSQELDKAAEFYKQSLRLNPRDEDAKYNLELLTKRQEEQKKDNQKQDQKKDQKQNKDQKNQQNQGGGGQGQQKDQQDKKDNQEGQGQGQADKKDKDQEKKDQQSQGDQSNQEQNQENQGKSGQSDQEKNTQKEPKGQGAGEGGEEKEQPKTPEEMRAEQILGALDDQEKQVFKAQQGGIKNPASRARRTVEKDW